MLYTFPQCLDLSRNSLNPNDKKCQNRIPKMCIFYFFLKTRKIIPIDSELLDIFEQVSISADFFVSEM